MAKAQVVPGGVADFRAGGGGTQGLQVSGSRGTKTN